MLKHIISLVSFLISNKFAFRLKLRSISVLLKDHYKIYKLKLVRKLRPNCFNYVQREFLLIEGKVGNRGCLDTNKGQVNFSLVIYHQFCIFNQQIKILIELLDCSFYYLFVFKVNFQSRLIIRDQLKYRNQTFLKLQVIHFIKNIILVNKN